MQFLIGLSISGEVLRPDDLSIYPMPSAPLHSLLGRIGDGGSMFAIGEGAASSADNSGALQLRINDADPLENNEGAFIVVVEIAEEEE